MKAIGVACACHAESEFDSSRGVPFDAFVYSRVIASILKHYRQEWKYGYRHICTANDIVSFAEDPIQPRVVETTLRDDSSAQVHVSEWLTQSSESEQWLIQKLFWEKRSESEIAQGLGISQQAVSKRKRRALKSLRVYIEHSEKKSNGSWL